MKRVFQEKRNTHEVHEQRLRDALRPVLLVESVVLCYKTEKKKPAVGKAQNGRRDALWPHEVRADDVSLFADVGEGGRRGGGGGGGGGGVAWYPWENSAHGNDGGGAHYGHTKVGGPVGDTG
ncbi:hypothetical protein Y032_0136g1955 [Ancylostoma ceylanicum]|uniref:Uncharacterized protein n=1 Tax=Ancylostoma ceylanicum TaxID=53326 RepID=A0A016T574_9BILA|nr:hypothetical protein Y032_0136g1955 [Ancylostoma ceylanicum]